MRASANTINGKYICMPNYVPTLQELDRTKLSWVGGKAANLGELTKIDGINVPPGFCITTDAFKSALQNHPELANLINKISGFSTAQRREISEVAIQIRRLIQDISLSTEIRDQLTKKLVELGEYEPYAIRSSATAEDLPSASFAGQQDTYLNVVGKEKILSHIRKCWSSLFTDRAITYRLQNGFDHSKVYLAVIVQKMIFPQYAGIMFTADPVTNNRKTISIDAGFGLGEALVSGIVSADNFKVSNNKIIGKTIAEKKRAIYDHQDGGTYIQNIEADQQQVQTLNDGQILQLARLGKQIEEHFDAPQDIEWCIADNDIYIVQSRPITILYPLPHNPENRKRIYASVGHQQMMTDAIRPLGISFFQLLSGRPMYEAGGRLFVEIAEDLASVEGRKRIFATLGNSDPLTKNALQIIVERSDLSDPLPENTPEQEGQNSARLNQLYAQAQNVPEPSVVRELINNIYSSVDDLKETIFTKQGSELFDYIIENIGTLRKLNFDMRSFAVILAAINASAWLNEKIYEWLGEKNVADILTQSVDNNITSQMGLDLLNVADEIRPRTDVITYLERINDDNFLEEVRKQNGGNEVADTIQNFLDKYGMRCVGEIDISKPRWSEKPSTIVPLILSNIRNFPPGAGSKRFEEGRHEAQEKEKDLLARLRQLEDGEEKAREAKEKIDAIRNFSGYREYPKYGIVSHFYLYKQALMKEAEKLVMHKLIKEKEDVFYLRFDEFREVVQTNQLDYTIISKRKEDYVLFEKLNPPRVMTSDGEIIRGKYRREDIPAGAIPGLAVSSGIVEGRARVILKLDEADVQKGDILVTAFTDPSWTPLFVAVSGLITEVGGLMTHGAVIAREYGLPAVVGVENATTLIKDGDRIRVNGTDGYVELLEKMSL